MPYRQLLVWADRLRDISARGLCYSRDSHDRENYRTIRDIAAEMLARGTDRSDSEIKSLCDALLSRPTPLSYAEGAVIDDLGNILLVKRPDSGLWILPGGALEVGETPAEGAAREVLEETGVVCRATGLAGVFNMDFDVACHPGQMYVLTFLCQRTDTAVPTAPLHPGEVSDMGWFAEDALPDRLYPKSILHITEAFRVWRGEDRAFFDR
uniref:ADP-ribose pyrophosphatase YjhB, NUDIX family n=1 Tax=Candidatus Kentrum sp. TUN TaxID=2126343 RepID=A0A451A164_9GAMM|nr:MAG: ADP-ribose pyrophosphatase YjhB, NUDIX family [Candidatus Kentron sp. TUN]